MHRELNIKLLKIIILFVLCLTLISIAGLAFPGFVYCRTYDYSENTVANALLFNSIGKNIMAEANPAATETGDTFYPILITSVVVLGVLVFALWQTFKSKRHI
jgi:hypothetical protein